MRLPSHDKALKLMRLRYFASRLLNWVEIPSISNQAWFLLKELVICGVGYHHAGLDVADRKNVETMFVRGDLPVLCE